MRTFARSILVGALALVGCGAPPELEETTAPAVGTETVTSAIANTPDSPMIGPYHVKSYNDCRGLVQSAVWVCISRELKDLHKVTCPVGDPSYVAVGGGAEVAGASGHPGAFLVDAHVPFGPYPSWNIDVYRAASKSHLQAHPHQLYTYVIGLKINGVSRQQLIANMQQHKFVIGPATANETWQRVPAGRLYLSTSTQLVWAPTDGVGQLLVGQWGGMTTGDFGFRTRSLGQDFSTRLEGYALSLPYSIGGVNLAGREAQANVHSGSGLGQVQVTVPRVALTHMGAWAYSAGGAGRALQAIAPTWDGTWTVLARSKDHVTSDGGGTYVGVSGISQNYQNQCVPPL